MCPCSPSFPSGSPGTGAAGATGLGASSCSSVSFPVPPVGPPGFPFSPTGLNLPFPVGFPEDLLCLLNLFDFLLPSGSFSAHLSINFGKDIFDAIMKLLDQFMPFLMLYKFFLPILELIICIIEVLCALMNPFALIAALDRLFTVCIPNFLNLFPIFALILMIISLLLLLLALIEYIINQIILFIEAILRNINALIIAFQIGNAVGILAIANKLSTLLCVFGNLMVLMALFGIIIGVFQDLLSMLFAIPPCEGGNNSNCCGPLTCPNIVQAPYTNTTGTFQYLNEVDQISATPGFEFLTADLRTESWQLYDTQQTLPQQFWNIVDGYDVVAEYNIDGYALPVPVYFPTGTTFTATTPPMQAAYTINLRLLYNPAQWGRSGTPHYIRFNNCIVLAAPTQSLSDYQNNQLPIPNGVLYIAGGLGYLDDNKTAIHGYEPDGITPLPINPISPAFNQASLNNFLHQATTVITTATLPNDGYSIQDVTYTFTPNQPVLMGAQLITAGCQPQFMISRAFVNNVMFANIAAQTSDLKSLINSSSFPNPAATQQCITGAIATLRSNMTTAGVADFQSTALTCLATLQTATQNALGSVIGIGFSPTTSDFTIDPNIQFTTQPIIVTVNLNENSSQPITKGIPASTAANLASQIVGYPTFGELSSFTYDGYQTFTANLTSDTPGTGSITVAFQNKMLSTLTMPTTGTPGTPGTTGSSTIQTLDYQFIYAPNVSGESTGVKPRRDAGDLARDSIGD